MVENLQFFGGRGASSGLSDKGKKYGSEEKTDFKGFISDWKYKIC